MRKLLLAAWTAALVLPAAAPARAQAPIQLTEEHVRRSPLAVPPPRAALFISPSGEPFRGPGGLAAWFAQVDGDHDGALTPAEFQVDALRAFRLYDADGDGAVDGFEIQAYERQRVPELGDVMSAALGEDEGRRGRRRGPRGHADAPTKADFTPAGRLGAARYALVNEPEPLLAADADVDGKVSLAEWTRATARRFAALDRTGAGRLTLEALRAPPKK
jgi:hypothetical protein